MKAQLEVMKPEQLKEIHPERACGDDAYYNDVRRTNFGNACAFFDTWDEDDNVKHL